MFHNSKFAGLTAFAILLNSLALFGQSPKTQQETRGGPASASTSTSASPSANAKGMSTARACIGCELPVVLRENVVAGKTPVGTKVEARLVMATMTRGGVIPRDTLISGEVVESVAKSGNSPSRLAIRMDSAEWKNGSMSFRFFLTAWFYPPVLMPPQNLSYGPPSPSKNPGGTDYTEPANPMSGQKWPPQHDDDNGMNAAAPASMISKERVLMKNVESTRGPDGSVVLVSSHSNIKLNKSTTYVLGVNNLFAGK
jgi:hypothetical protein